MTLPGESRSSAPQGEGALVLLVLLVGALGFALGTRLAARIVGRLKVDQLLADVRRG